MPLSTLQETPRDVPSKTRGQDGVATSFPVGLLHPLQHAGLSRRSPVSPSFGSNRERFGESWQITSAKRTYQLSKSFLVGHPRSGPARQNRAKLSPQCSLGKTTSRVRIRDCQGAAVVPRGFQLFSKRH